MIKIWNAKTMEELVKLEGHKDAVFSCAFSHDGKFIVSGSCDKTAKLWNIETGEELGVLEVFYKRLS